MPSVQQAVHAALHKDQFSGRNRAQIRQKVMAGTHRFDIHRGQAICLRPQGFLKDRAEERARKSAENTAAAELWSRRYAVRTPDGLEIRER